MGLMGARPLADPAPARVWATFRARTALDRQQWRQERPRPTQHRPGAAQEPQKGPYRTFQVTWQLPRLIFQLLVTFLQLSKLTSSKFTSTWKVDFENWKKLTKVGKLILKVEQKLKKLTLKVRKN